MVQASKQCPAHARTVHHLRALALYGQHVAKPNASRTRVSTAIRLPVDLHAELQRQADERDVSVNYLVTRAVDHYLRQLGPADPLMAPGAGEEREGILT